MNKELFNQKTLTNTIQNYHADKKLNVLNSVTLFVKCYDITPDA